METIKIFGAKTIKDVNCKKNNVNKVKLTVENLEKGLIPIDAQQELLKIFLNFIDKHCLDEPLLKDFRVDTFNEMLLCLVKGGFFVNSWNAQRAEDLSMLLHLKEIIYSVQRDKIFHES